MRLTSPTRASKVAVGTSIVLLLLAMMLPVCHLHPLMDRSAPDHCTICITLHAALPMGAHVPATAEPLLPAGHVIVAAVQEQSEQPPRFAECRAPPLPAC